MPGSEGVQGGTQHIQAGQRAHLDGQGVAEGVQHCEGPAVVGDDFLQLLVGEGAAQGESCGFGREREGCEWYVD